ncbi:MAG: triose-phosphate isomerase [Gammaproteobacteria bacterium]
MRRPLVAGNWKMNGSKKSVEELLKNILAGADESASAEIVVCPPNVYLGQVESLLAGTGVAWGAQNICQVSTAGAYTGEISDEMLKDFGCSYVIVGHSERRTIYGETDELIAERFSTAQQAGIVPILCVGELLEEREQGTTEQVIARQLDATINHAGIAAFASAVIAYEPVWAIGTGKTATVEQAQQVHEFIRSRIASHDADIANKIRILYGGSVKPSNAADLISMPDIDGGLIGGASLQAEDFLAICQAA